MSLRRLPPLLPVLLALLPGGPALGAPADKPAATVRVLVQNIYGRKENDCEERFKALAKQILSASPPYDVVALQEHWKVPHDHWVSCDADVLTKALEADGRYAGAGRSIRHLPRTDDVLQLAGGVSVFTRHKIVDAYEAKFVNSSNFPLSGYALARVELAPGMQLDLWDAHLEAGSDGCDDDCRWEAATDMGSEIELFSGLPEKDKSGNPVLIVGDFNTGGPMSKTEKPPFAGNGGYGNVMDALKNPRDLWLELGAGSGYTYDCGQNHTQKCKDRERIDYVLLPEHPKILSPKSDFYLVPTKLEVVRWKTPKGTEISDHYGLDVTVEMRARPKAPSAGVGKASAALKAGLDALGSGAIVWDGKTR